MIDLHCAICGEKEQLTELYVSTLGDSRISGCMFSARRTPDRMHYRFVKCLRCGLIFSTPILELGEIVALYSKSSFHYSPESKFLKKTYGQLLEKILSGKDSTQLRLLDIGCGNGFFLEEAINRGIKDVWGVEPGKASVRIAKKFLKDRIRVNILRPELFKSGTFDIITCFHTLDHVTDPNSFLSTTRSLLKKGGRVIFIVHDTEGLSVRLFGEKSPIFDIEHIYLFNPSTLSDIFKKNRYRVEEIFNVKNSYPLSYWFRMTPIPKGIKLYLNKFLDSTHLGRIPFSLSAGNIGIIARK
jgi:SAM-dependent methyltransferase